jgi:hypothetical protein
MEDRRKYRDTVTYNIEASRSICSVAQPKRRYNISVPAKKYRRLEPSCDTISSKIITPNLTKQNGFALSILHLEHPLLMLRLKALLLIMLMAVQT